MSEKVAVTRSSSWCNSQMALIRAEPESLEIDVQRTAVLVVDMQNAFVSKGGMVDMGGGDISKLRKTIQPIQKILTVARGRGLKVVFIAHRYSPDLRESGGPDSPAWYKSDQKGYREHPEWRDKFLVSGTWGAEIIEELKPEKDDMLVLKPRYSAFFGTNLDIILRTCKIKYLIFTGVATNICVETSIRDAYNLAYFPILVSDATAAMGPPSVQETTVDNVKKAFGWVAASENITMALAKNEVINEAL